MVSCVSVPCVCPVCLEEDSGSDEDTMQYYSPASDLGLRSRRRKKPKTHNKSSQSLFSVILTVNHGLVALQTAATVRLQDGERVTRTSGTERGSGCCH